MSAATVVQLHFIHDAAKSKQCNMHRARGSRHSRLQHCSETKGTFTEDHNLSIYCAARTV